MNETDVAAVNASHFKDREYPRCELRISTQLELEDGRSVEFRMSNLSQNGFAGHSIEQAPIGSEIEVVLPKIGSVPARVVWQIGTAIGARLFSELTVQQIIALALDNLKAAEESQRASQAKRSAAG
jgi:hypothetical protein